MADALKVTSTIILTGVAGFQFSAVIQREFKIALSIGLTAPQQLNSSDVTITRFSDGPGFIHGNRSTYALNVTFDVRCRPQDAPILDAFAPADSHHSHPRPRRCRSSKPTTALQYSDLISSYSVSPTVPTGFRAVLNSRIMVLVPKLCTGSDTKRARALEHYEP